VVGIFSFNLVLAEQTPQEEKAALEQELKDLEVKIVQYESDYTKTKAEKDSLAKQVSLLKTKINNLNTQIKQSNLMIKDVTVQIKDTETSIVKTGSKIDDLKIELGNVLRTIYIENQKSLIEVFLTEPNMSDFFDNAVALNNLYQKATNLLGEITGQKSYLEGQKQSLDFEKDDLQKTLKMQTLQKQSVESSKKEQEQILELTKGKESTYQKLLAAAKARATEIRNRLFALAGVSTSNAPTFGEALDIAKYVSKITGVRAAFLLAILTQESNLGKNVGQCNCPTCKYPGLALSDVLKPTRDLEPFKEICESLSRDPKVTPVSCPMYMNGKRVGYGGAMGPAQFIPSTWMLYKAKIEAITGKKPADPWNIRDAFLAAALYVKDYGASSQKENDEWRSAMIYFAGTVNTKYRFYADSVLNIAEKYEQDIKDMEAGGITSK
jgi:peptidoglycan hydrolase CwlO-like protein